MFAKVLFSLFIFSAPLISHARSENAQTLWKTYVLETCTDAFYPQSSYHQKCIQIMTAITYISSSAQKICLTASSEAPDLAVQCLQVIQNKEYGLEELYQCRSSAIVAEKVECLQNSGSFMPL